MSERQKPLLIFDGDCGFCRRRVEEIRRMTAAAVDYAPSDEVAAEFPEIPSEEYISSVVLVRPDGSWLRGAEAIFEACSHGRGLSRLGLWLYRHLPGFRPLSEWGYAQVAKRRIGLSALERTLRGKQPSQSSFRTGAWVFQKLLALTYLVAFLSLAPQITGLVGAGGILPIQDVLEPAAEMAANEGLARWQLLPSLVWADASDAALRWHCWIGAGLAVLLLLGLVPLVSTLGLWLAYESISAAGNVFTMFQWDLLLCEVGLLAVFLVPWRWRSRLADQPAPPGLARWLCWLLLVRLMFFSGLVKLTSPADPLDPNAWLDLSALQYHFQTQPLPTPLAHWFNGLPVAVLNFACLAMFAVELLAPILIFCGRRARLVGVASIAALQILIAATGNYGFFNLLTLALCALLVDDSAWRIKLAPLKPLMQSVGARLLGRLRGVLLIGYALVCLWASSWLWVQLAGRALQKPELVRSAQEQLAPLQSLRAVNPYGLFAKMSKYRFEVELQGSADGESWSSYGFHYKPEGPQGGLAYVAPHMPRLDWQMWFLPLSSYQSSRWFQTLLVRLLEGAPEVTALFAHNPFPDQPPRYMQALLVRYEMTTPAERRASGDVWKTEFVGPYVAPLELGGLGQPGESGR